jgi:hypothetical protein
MVRVHPPGETVGDVNERMQRQEQSADQCCRPRALDERESGKGETGQDVGAADVADEMRVERARAPPRK